MSEHEDLDERKASILRAVVEEYVETAQPVGSGTIARSRDLGVSSATVRNDMTVLEREGYLVQPHTSAGRIPTDMGYRFFVDHFTNPNLPLGQRRAVSDFFTRAHRALEDLLNETSQFLARITAHAAVVVGPQPDAAHVRSIQLVALQPNVVVAVAVMSSGSVEKEFVSLERDDEIDGDQLARLGAWLTEHLQGERLAALAPPASTGDPALDRLATQVCDSLAARGADASEPVYVGGASRLAAEGRAFSTQESAARLLELLEHQVVVVSLVQNLIDHGVAVRIGAENNRAELRECSLVLAPYTIEGDVAGTVAVLGPTRMDYQQALAAVAAVSNQLGRLLSG
ncbi:MAG: heat-inducible transcription repressor HrcA [Actinobacteria bacterium]|nr:heat-inducible transcription repressor HrcA [Actinomycetota bacterium]